MTRNRPRATILAIAALTILATLALAPGVAATFPARNGSIAFMTESNRGVEIFSVRSNGKQLRQLTDVDDGAAVPDWSPDGRQIVVTVAECAIGMMDADGGNLHEIASEPGRCLGDANFTPDGTRLVYTRFDFALEVEQIWSMKVDGSDRRFITDAGGPDPNVSPDGRKISFKGPPDGALFVANIDGSDVVQISPSISVTYKHDWAPDGQHIVISSAADYPEGRSPNLATIRPDGSDLQMLTSYTGGTVGAFAICCRR
jgi:Tol biopolymer transport system component